MSVVGIVLAGGASSRFGSDKLAAKIDGRPLLHHALERVAVIADQIVLVLAPGQPVPLMPLVLEGRIILARDAAALQGPLAGLVAGLAVVDPGAVAIVVGGDMPWLEPAVLQLLIESVATIDGPAAAVLEADPVATLPLALRVGPALIAARTLRDANRRSLRALLDVLGSETVPADTWRARDPDATTLRDIDLPADLGTMQAL